MVKLLVATTEGQGLREGDYACAVDGELVYLPEDECGVSECGCTQGFAGMASNRSTTTALVVDRPDFSELDVLGALHDALERRGWVSSEWSEADESLFEFLFLRVVIAASAYPVGTVLERDGHRLRKRMQVEPVIMPPTSVAGEAGCG